MDRKDAEPVHHAIAAARPKYPRGATPLLPEPPRLGRRVHGRPAQWSVTVSGRFTQHPRLVHVLEIEVSKATSVV